MFPCSYNQNWKQNQTRYFIKYVFKACKEKFTFVWSNHCVQNTELFCLLRTVVNKLPTFKYILIKKSNWEARKLVILIVLYVMDLLSW